MTHPTEQDTSPSADIRPTDFDGLKMAIAARYDSLSKRLQQVAEFALAHPDDMALETIAVIASRAKVPPSSLIRFSKALGFDGFTRMQRLFRDRLMTRMPSHGERIRRLYEESGSDGPPGPARMLHDMAAAGIEGLERLRQDMPAERLGAAIDLLSEAKLTHVVAQRRAFAVASYAAYFLNALEQPTRLLDGVGGMLDQQGRAITRDDVLFAISFRPYSQDVTTLVGEAKTRGVPLITISDGPLSPLARLADVSFELTEIEAHGFRPLSAPMCLVLALSVSLGQHLAAKG